jgi:hypothetical protein
MKINVSGSLNTKIVYLKIYLVKEVDHLTPFSP